MIYITTGNKKYRCTAPDEHRINIHPQSIQWVIDFTICDTITTAELDTLLRDDELMFVFVDDATGDETMLTFRDYTKTNSVSIKYNQDLSCTASVQLGKEIETNVCQI